MDQQYALAIESGDVRAFVIFEMSHSLSESWDE